PDTPRPFRPRRSASGFRSDQILFLTRVSSPMGFRPARDDHRLAHLHFSFSYSFLASIKIGRSVSASFHNPKKSSYALRLLSMSPVSAAARASPRCASGYKGLSALL